MRIDDKGIQQGTKFLCLTEFDNGVFGFELCTALTLVNDDGLLQCHVFRGEHANDNSKWLKGKHYVATGVPKRFLISVDTVLLVLLSPLQKANGPGWSISVTDVTRIECTADYVKMFSSIDQDTERTIVA